MLASYTSTIKHLVFIYAHTGQKVDHGNRIYDITAVKISTGRTPEQISSFVRYRPFTARERYRSNLSKSVLENAPQIKAIQKEFKQFLSGQQIAFAFSAGSDLELVKRFCGIERMVDLNFCAAYFLQQIESHTFKRLWEFLYACKRDKFGFSSEEIVRLGVELVKYIAGTALNDQKYPYASVLRYYLKESDTLFGKVLVHVSRNFKDYFQSLFSPCVKSDTGDWYGFLKPASKSPVRDDERAPHRAVGKDQISERFKFMATSDKNIVHRSTQIEYAHLVIDALNKGAALCVEAGTGTGKTQGYLIPVLEFLWRNPGHRVAIATYTKSLQEQIFHRETHFTKSLFNMYRDIPVAYLKGKSSYVCVEKLEGQFDAGATGVQLLSWLYLLNNVYQFPEADLDSVSDAIKPYLDGEFLFSHLQNAVSARQGCTPRHRYCPAHVVTCKAKAARLVITNHHKLVLMEKDPLLKGLFRNYVIDEANHFEKAVRGAFRDEISTTDLFNALNYLDKRVGKITHGKTDKDVEKLVSGLGGIRKLRDEIHLLRTALLSVNPGIHTWEERTLIAAHPGFREGDIRSHLKAIAAQTRRIDESLKILTDEAVQRSLKIVGRTVRKMRTELEMLREFRETVHMITASLDEQNSVASYVVFKKGFALFAAPVEVDSIIRKNIYGERDAVIYTAATLCHDHRFDCFNQIVGLDRPVCGDDDAPPKRICTARIPSHFTRESMQLVVHPESLTGKFNNKTAWRERIVSLIPRLVENNNGRTLVLFSSYEDLQYTAARTFDLISEAGYPLLLQKPGEPTIGLCDEFRSIKASVLFGVDTFWYGVDFPGDTLTQVIITRMPYPSPSDPVQSARKHLVPAKAYWARYHYENEIKIKQGIGRLIRTHTDRGLVVFLDSRFKNLLDRIDQSLGRSNLEKRPR
jgi:ATP-dependent DNA helicase DinG